MVARTFTRSLSDAHAKTEHKWYSEQALRPRQVIAEALAHIDCHLCFDGSNGGRSRVTTSL